MLSTLLTAPAQGAFFLPENLPERPDHFDRAFAAAFRLEKFNNGGDCSAASVSSGGYALTDLHCVAQCLKDQKWAERGLLREQNGEGYGVLAISRQAPEDLECGGMFQTFGEETFSVPMRIVWLGRGKETFTEESVSSLPEEAFQAVRGNQDDFALVKFDFPKPVACVPPSRTPVKPGDRVWAIGYPSFTMRYDGFDSSGYKKHVSLGRVLSGPREDAFLKGTISEASAWKRLESIYSDEGIFLSDMDVMPGNSGSMVVDSDGNLAGIVYGTVRSSEKKYLGGSALAMRMEAILKELKEGLGEARLAEIFDCPP
jgi:hypothetical protein